MLHKGFTTAELLITLFVAAVFLASGYALFHFTIQDSEQVRAEVHASRLAGDYLDQFSLASGACAPATPISNEIVSSPGLSNVSVSVTVACPNPAAPNLGLVEVTVNYGSPTKSIKRSGYSVGGL